MTGRVIVVGSINLDLVVSAPRLPAPGETVLGGRLARHHGGKGANQAVAAARAGATVEMVGALGRDPEGDQGIADLANERVGTDPIVRVDAPSGVAIIAVAPDGENQIVVAPGANAELRAEQVETAFAALAPGPDDVVLVSLEVPMPAVARATSLAAAAEATLIVNPAPAAPLPDDVLATGPILTPNRGELSRLSGTDDVASGARHAVAAGAAAVIVTLGADGAVIFDGAEPRRLPAHRPPAVVDTTGAGDAFSGVLAAWLAAGSSIEDAARAAIVAAGLSVGAAGAREGMPARAAIDAALGA